MNDLKLIYTLILVCFITGCSTKIEYVPQVVIKEVKVPVKPTIPEYDCVFYGSTNSEVIDNLVKCIKDLKAILDNLKGENNGK